MSTVHPADLQLTSERVANVVSQPNPPYSPPRTDPSQSSAQRLYASSGNDDTSLPPLPSSPQPNLRAQSTQGDPSPLASTTSTPYPSARSDPPTRAPSNSPAASNLPYLPNPVLSNPMPGDRERVTDASQFYNERLVPQNSATRMQSHPRAQTVSEYSPSTLPPGGPLSTSRAQPNAGMMNVSVGPQGNDGTALLQGLAQAPSPSAASTLPGQTTQQMPYVQPSSPPAVQYPSSQSPGTAQAQGVNPFPMSQSSPPSTITSSSPQTSYTPSHANVPVTTPTFSPPPTGYSSSSTSYSSPSTNYSSPTTNYSSPTTSYSSPPTSYSSPPTSYSSPAMSYSSPPTNYSSPPAPYPSPPTNVVPAPTGYSPSPMGYPTSYPFPVMSHPSQPASYPVPSTTYAPQAAYPMQPHQPTRGMTTGAIPQKTDIGGNVALEIGKSMAGMFGKSVLKAATNSNGDIVGNVTDLAIGINPNSGGNQDPSIGTGNTIPNVNGLFNGIPTLGTGVQPDFNAQYQILSSQYQQLQVNQSADPSKAQNMQMLLHQMQQLQMAHHHQQMQQGMMGPQPTFQHQAVHHQQVAVGYHHDGSAVVPPSQAEIQAAVGKAAKYMKAVGKVAKFASTGRI